MLVDELENTGNWKLCKEFVSVANYNDVHWKEKGTIIINIDTISVITKTRLINLR